MLRASLLAGLLLLLPCVPASATLSETKGLDQLLACRQFNADFLRQQASAVVFSAETQSLEYNWIARVLDYTVSNGTSSVPSNALFERWINASDWLCLDDHMRTKFLSRALINRHTVIEAIVSASQSRDRTSFENQQTAEAVRISLDTALGTSDWAPSELVEAQLVLNRLKGISSLIPKSQRYLVKRAVLNAKVVNGEATLKMLNNRERLVSESSSLDRASEGVFRRGSPFTLYAPLEQPWSIMNSAWSTRNSLLDFTTKPSDLLMATASAAPSISDTDLDDIQKATDKFKMGAATTFAASVLLRAMTKGRRGL